MPVSRFGTLQKASAIVPLALLSVAWTASLTTTGSASGRAAAADSGGLLPDGSRVPAQAIEAPASVSAPDKTSGSVGGVEGNAREIVAGSSTSGIPAQALAAYQRAETVINAADKSCNLSWQLVAAIGRVESDHGRFGGSELDARGVASPAIRGIALDGRNDTAVIRDTDAGQYDDDPTFDRAVGPMQFIPSTWAVVGVDADNDGVRDPQDIDDAALATAVYLCSGKDDLATLAGQRASVFRYNHSEAYVDLVLSIMDAYLDGDFTSVPEGTSAAGNADPTPLPGRNDGDDGRGDRDRDRGGPRDQPVPSAEQVPGPDPTGTTDPDDGGSDNGSGDGGGSGDGDGSTGGGGGGDGAGDGGSGGSGGTGGGGSGGGGPDLPDVPQVIPTELPTTGVEPLDDLLTLTQAALRCTAEGFINNLLRNDDPFDQCVKRYTT
ncbi:lytic transglycosylase domain-containing protein [Nocardioides dongxiaopingii]|uniref:lytic transglycosylase domain-containing protein n=1 Tax=Nocardioides sp. S-1144 TaxID=2582905 RepID=UPI0021CB7182|nr:lytic transglycosylase domain-containing protein [Nocardioides sp. S-1144]